MDYWLELRHTGANGGVGLVEWGADEKDRFASRKGQRSPTSQIIEFVEKHGLLSDAAKVSKTKIFTNIERLISSPQVRDRLGINISGGQVTMLYPTAEVAKSLTRVVEDLKNKDTKVKHIYNVKDRVDYIMSLPADVLPNADTRFEQPQLLGSTIRPGVEPPKPRRTAKRRKSSGERVFLVPDNCHLVITQLRINDVYVELSKLDADEFANACAVLLRVFVELSVEHYLVNKGVSTEKRFANHVSLQHKMTEAGDHLEQNNVISPQLNKVVKSVATGQGVLAASVLDMHLYIHNQYAFPKALGLKAAWDELQPFIEALWK